MKGFNSIILDLATARRELEEFGKLLRDHTTLSERSDILPFFKKREQLSALFGLLHGNINNYDLVAYEFQLFGDFSCDLVTGDSETCAFCLVEFEDAVDSSIFSGLGKRSRPCWGRRMEQGFGQIIDWLWKLDDFKNTKTLASLFGSNNASYIAILVIGRTAFLKGVEKDRFEWRRNSVIIGSSKIHCFTYDEIYRALSKKLKIIDYKDDANLIPVNN